MKSDTHLDFDEAMNVGRLDAHDQAELVRTRQLSAAELVEAAIVRTQILNETLHAVSFCAFDFARARARGPLSQGPLSGVPYLLKDSFNFPGMPSRGGSRLMSSEPSDDLPPFASRLDGEGLIPIGKTSMPEFGLLPSTEPVLYGPVSNPWADDRSPGGSSGGAAAAVASGMTPLAHASDGGGSIRIPASCCGVFGFKPSRGLNVRARRAHAIEDLLCGDGVLSRTVRDAAYVALRVRPQAARFAQPMPTRQLRIGVALEGLTQQQPDPAINAAIESAASLCASLGHDVERLELPISGPAVLNAFKTLWGYLAGDVVDRCATWASPDEMANLLEPWTRDLARWGETLTVLDLEGAYRTMATLEHDMAQVFSRWDIILSPVLREPPVKIGRLSPTQPFELIMREMFDYIAYTPLQNLAGLPAMSAPLFANAEGLPIGSMFTAARDADDLLLALAFQLEEAAPWSKRWPELARHEKKSRRVGGPV